MPGSVSIFSSFRFSLFNNLLEIRRDYQTRSILINLADPSVEWRCAKAG